MRVKRFVGFFQCGYVFGEVFAGEFYNLFDEFSVDGVRIGVGFRICISGVIVVRRWERMTLAAELRDESLGSGWFWAVVIWLKWVRTLIG